MIEESYEGTVSAYHEEEKGDMEEELFSEDVNLVEKAEEDVTIAASKTNDSDYNEFSALEIESFTKGLYLDGEYYTGRILRDYIFTLEGLSFSLAVNQMDLNQAGSLNGIVDPIQAEMIEKTIIHTGFETFDFVKRSSLRLFSFMAMAIEPEWPEPGAIYLDKNAESLGNNSWEMELLIRGKDFEATNDVVLVFDNSNNVGEQDLRAAKIAAERFGETLLTEGSLTRISIVRFAGDILETTPFYTYETLGDYKAKVALIAQQGGNGSNLQAGIHKGHEVLYGSNLMNQKNMVILGSSNPTYSFPFAGIENTDTCISNHKNQNEKQSGVTVNDPVWPVPLGPDYSTIIGSGSQFSMHYNAYVDVTCQHGFTNRYPYGNFDVNENFTAVSGTDNGVGAIWEAKKTIDSGTNIFAIAFNAGIDGENVLNATASNSSNYFVVRKNDEIAPALENAFSSIASKVSIAAKNGSVNDPMGELVDLVYSGIGPIITEDLAVYTGGNADIYISQGSAVYDIDTETINWRTGNINEGEDVIMRYRINLDPNSAVQPGEKIYPNGTTTFSYNNYSDTPVVKEFKVPVITVQGDTIDVYYYVVNENGEPVNSAGVRVPLENAQRLDEESYTNVYGTYGFTAANFDGYVYYGYIIDGNDQIKDIETVSITTVEPARNPKLWFGYYKGKTKLRISKTGTDSIDENQSFLFRVEGNGTDLTVSLKGDGAVIIKDLPAGKYTVTEITDWSFRYTPEASVQEVTTTPANMEEVLFVNRRTTGKWLGGESWLRNIFAAFRN